MSYPLFNNQIDLRSRLNNDFGIALLNNHINRSQNEHLNFDKYQNSPNPFNKIILIQMPCPLKKKKTKRKKKSKKKKHKKRRRKKLKYKSKQRRRHGGYKKHSKKK